MTAVTVRCGASDGVASITLHTEYMQRDGFLQFEMNQWKSEVYSRHIYLVGEGFERDWAEKIRGWSFVNTSAGYFTEITCFPR